MMEIGGFQGVSLIDYPGKIASIVFLAGCNLRCPYCHNPDLVFKNYKKLNRYSETGILKRLESSKRFIEAVEITGGEPTLQIGLSDFISKCKDLGLLVKLDTNGSNPLILKEILDKGIVDYVAMDIKSALEPDKYRKATGTPNCFLGNAMKSIESIMDSSPDYEFRTTVVPSLVEIGDLAGIAAQIEGANAYYLQQFVPENALNPLFSKITPYPTESLISARNQIRQLNLVKKCEIRA